MLQCGILIPMKEELLTILMVISSSILVGILCYETGYQAMQQDAVNQNMAHWTIDKERHVKFEWINK